jgi:uncharacterized protein
MKKILVIFLLFFIGAKLFAQNSFDAKSLLQPQKGKQTLVNDFAGILTDDQKQALEKKLVTFNDSTSTQIAVVIIPELSGYEISDYNTQLGRAWGVGGKEFNNGVVLLISKNDRKLNIATGYGVEGALPDITCKHIIDEVIVPEFKGNDYYRGIDEGTDAIMLATKGEYTEPQVHQGKQVSLGKIIFIIIIVIFVLISISGTGGGGGTFMSRGGFGPIFWGGLGGGSSNWGGGGSSGGGGGFGGFGGGSFGGGGASGSW